MGISDHSWRVTSKPTCMSCDYSSAASMGYQIPMELQHFTTNIICQQSLSLHLGLKSKRRCVYLASPALDQCSSNMLIQGHTCIGGVIQQRFMRRFPAAASAGGWGTADAAPAAMMACALVPWAPNALTPICIEPVLPAVGPGMPPGPPLAMRVGWPARAPATSGLRLRRWTAGGMRAMPAVMAAASRLATPEAAS